MLTEQQNLQTLKAHTMSSHCLLHFNRMARGDFACLAEVFLSSNLQRERVVINSAIPLWKAGVAAHSCGPGAWEAEPEAPEVMSTY